MFLVGLLLNGDGFLVLFSKKSRCGCAMAGVEMFSMLMLMAGGG